MVIFDNILQNSFVYSPLDGHGETIIWKRGSKCPCSPLADANRGLLSCVVCKGAGWVYDPPVQMIAILTGIRNEKNLLEAGVVQPGDMIMGCAPAEGNFISDWDIIQTTWPLGQPYEGETVEHGDGPTDKLNYAPIQVLECFTVDPASGLITHFHSDDPDFSISDRFITWNIPMAEGTVFSIKYTTNFEWIAFSPPVDRYDAGRIIGQKILLRKRHIVLPHS